MKIGFVGLGNVGGKLAGSLLRNNFDLTVRDLDDDLTKTFVNLGAKVANSAKELAEKVDLIITCLPSPKICAEVMDAEDGIIDGLSKSPNDNSKKSIVNVFFILIDLKLSTKYNIYFINWLYEKHI